MKKRFRLQRLKFYLRLAKWTKAILLKVKAASGRDWTMEQDTQLVMLDRDIAELDLRISQVELSIQMDKLDQAEREHNYRKYKALQPFIIRIMPTFYFFALGFTAANAYYYEKMKAQYIEAAGRYELGYVEKLESYYNLCWQREQDIQELLLDTRDTLKSCLNRK